MSGKYIALSGTTFHLLDPISFCSNAFLYKWWRFLYMTELTFFLCHFLSVLACFGKVFFAIVNCLLVGCICVYVHSKVHYSPILLCNISVVFCTFHDRIH